VRALLDVNVLLALFDPEHKHHDEAQSWWNAQQEQGWASCPLTQNGFIRVISNPAYERPLPLSGAVALMQAQAGRPGHVFWPDDISFADAAIFDHDRLQGPNQSPMRICWRLLCETAAASQRSTAAYRLPPYAARRPSIW
jgi:uncharacterized protein